MVSKPFRCVLRMPGTFAVFALGLEGPNWWPLGVIIWTVATMSTSPSGEVPPCPVQAVGFTAQSLPVLVHGVQSMQELKPAKEFRTLIANEENLDALLEIKGHLEYYLPEESGRDKGRRPACGGMCSGPSGAHLPKTAAARSSRRARRN